jgi:hypothetical protein
VQGDPHEAHDATLQTFPGLSAFSGPCQPFRVGAWQHVSGEFTTEWTAAQKAVSGSFKSSDLYATGVFRHDSGAVVVALRRASDPSAAMIYVALKPDPNAQPDFDLTEPPGISRPASCGPSSV